VRLKGRFPAPALPRLPIDRRVASPVCVLGAARLKVFPLTAAERMW
jgi:hypothetical protein